MTKYNIGDELWRAVFESAPDYLPCPDCGTTCVMTVRLWDGIEHTIACQTCKNGYEGATGYLQVYKRAPLIAKMTVTQIEVQDHVTRYNYADECDLFTDEASAHARAAEKAADADREDRERALRRVKDKKSWAWHVSYHRREAQRHREQVGYHEAQLAVAKVEAKRTP